MTIKTHIAISATISLALIAIIACQKQTQESKVKEPPKAVTEQKAKVEEVMNNVEQEAKVETEKVETKVNEVIEKAKEEAKEIESKVEEVVASPSLFVNSDFSKGLDNWGHDKNVNVIQENGKNIIELIGSPKDQTRVWQSINTTSGHVYTLTLKVKSEQKNALVIFRDYQKETEKIHYLNPTPEWKEYKKVFKSTRHGNCGVYLSCKEEGKFYYSDISIIDTTPEE